MQRQSTAIESPVEYATLSRAPGYRLGTDGTAWTCLRRKSFGKPRGIIWVESPEWKILNPFTVKGPKDYLKISIRIDGKKKQRFVHCLVLEAFRGPCPKGMECCHWDGNKQNNRLSNIRWGTKMSNIEDSYRLNAFPRGEDAENSKLTDESVGKILSEYAQGNITQTVLAVKNNVSQVLISMILLGKIWTHVDGPRKTGGNP